jgi:hypothetical protein
VGAGAGAHHCGGGGAAHHPACYAYHHVSSPWACLSAGRTDANSVLNSLGDSAVCRRSRGQLDGTRRLTERAQRVELSTPVCVGGRSEPVPKAAESSGMGKKCLAEAVRRSDSGERVWTKRRAVSYHRWVLPHLTDPPDERPLNL